MTNTPWEQPPPTRADPTRSRREPTGEDLASRAPHVPTTTDVHRRDAAVQVWRQPTPLEPVPAPTPDALPEPIPVERAARAAGVLLACAALFLVGLAICIGGLKLVAETGGGWSRWWLGCAVTIISLVGAVAARAAMTVPGQRRGRR